MIFSTFSISSFSFYYFSCETFYLMILKLLHKQFEFHCRLSPRFFHLHRLKTIFQFYFSQQDFLLKVLKVRPLVYSQCDFNFYTEKNPYKLILNFNVIPFCHFCYYQDQNRMFLLSLACKCQHLHHLRIHHNRMTFKNYKIHFYYFYKYFFK